LASRLSRNLKLSAIVHVGAVLAFCGFSFARFRRSPPPREELMFVQVQPQPPAPVPVVAPKPVPTPNPKPEPAPPKPRRRRKRIQRSTNRVTRVLGQAAPAPRPKLSAEEIKSRLSAGTVSAGATARVDDFPAWYYALVKQKMYDAWRQPSAHEVRPGLTARVLVQVRRDGSIVSRRLTGSSGNELMDRSVMTAVQSVGRLKELPREYSGPTKDIVIDFALTGR